MRKERRHVLTQHDYHPYWNPEGACGRCGERLGEEFAPVHNEGIWYHYDPCMLRVFAERRRRREQAAA